MYLFDFLKRLFKKNNIGTIIYLCMNLIMYIALMGGFALPEMIPMAMLIYVACLAIALSPIGEFILRVQCRCKKIKKAKFKDRLEPLFQEAYRRAKILDPTISDNVKFYMNKSLDPNAFAVGRKTVCVTRGLCELEDDEILGILAHEFGHIAHKDTDMLLVINVSNFLLTAVFFVVRVIVSFVIILVGGDERPIGSILASFFIDLLLVWLMSLWTRLGNLFHMKSSRANEYRADAFSCECGYGKNLYNALYKLEQKYGSGKEKGVFAALGSTHPETADRLDAIEEWTPGSLKIIEPTTPSQLGKQMESLKNKAMQQGGDVLQFAKNKAANVQIPKIPPMQPMQGQMAPPIPPTPSAKKISAIGGQLKEGETCYGRYSREGIYYFGQIMKISGDDVQFKFFDEVSDEINQDKIITLDAAIEQLQAFGNWNGQGAYYPCTIFKRTNDVVSVRYDEDTEIEENLKFEQLRFVNK
ncbi:MAG TPA: M48 family metalloprotease [Lachnospiraceae bacterium]|nr:M48 family metalloprotease [Lachnospiraceae bacterium]